MEAGKAPEVEDTYHGVDDHDPEVHSPEGEEGTHRVELGKGMPEMDDTLKHFAQRKL